MRSAVRVARVAEGIATPLTEAIVGFPQSFSG